MLVISAVKEGVLQNILCNTLHLFKIDFGKEADGRFCPSLAICGFARLNSRPCCLTSQLL